MYMGRARKIVGVIIKKRNKKMKRERKKSETFIYDIFLFDFMFIQFIQFNYKNKRKIFSKMCTSTPFVSLTFPFEKDPHL